MSSTDISFAGETIIYETKNHWGRLIPRGIFASIFALASLMGLGDFGVFIFYLSIAAFIFLPVLVPFLTDKLSITNKRIIGKTGLLKTKEMDSPLNKINNVSVSSGILGKVLDYGTIIITTSSGEYAFKAISRPNEFKNRLMAQINE